MRCSYAEVMFVTLVDSLSGHEKNGKLIVAHHIGNVMVPLI